MRTTLAALMLLAAMAPATAQTQSKPTPEAVKELAPTGKLRAAINFGNAVLAQKGADGTPQGITADDDQRIHPALECALDESPRVLGVGARDGHDVDAALV